MTELLKFFQVLVTGLICSLVILNRSASTASISTVGDEAIKLIEGLDSDDAEKVLEVSDALKTFTSEQSKETFKLNYEALPIDLIENVSNFMSEKHEPMNPDKSAKEQTWRAYNSSFDDQIVKPCAKVAELADRSGLSRALGDQNLGSHEFSEHLESREAADAVWRVVACLAIDNRKSVMAKHLFEAEFERAVERAYLKKWGFDQDIDTYMMNGPMRGVEFVDPRPAVERRRHPMKKLARKSAGIYKKSILS